MNIYKGNFVVKLYIKISRWSCLQLEQYSTCKLSSLKEPAGFNRLEMRTMLSYLNSTNQLYQKKQIKGEREKLSEGVLIAMINRPKFET